MQASSPVAAPSQPSLPALPPTTPRLPPVIAGSTHVHPPEVAVRGVSLSSPNYVDVRSEAQEGFSLLPLQPWDTLKSVSELSGGQSDAVYRLEFVDHPPVVLKTCSNAGAQAFASALAPVVGVSAPLVRCLPNECTEVETLQGALQRLSSSAPENGEAKRLSRRIALGEKPILLMENLQGTTLGGVGRSYLKNSDATALLCAIGRLAAFDIIMGNQDRFENFDLNDCLGGGELPANFGNIFLPSMGWRAGGVTAIDSCVNDDTEPGVERSIYLTRTMGVRRSQTTPSAILSEVLANPDTLNEYIVRNIVQMLEQVWALPPEATNHIQAGFVAGLHVVAERLTPLQLESVRKELGVGERAVPIATLESRIEGLRQLLREFNRG